MLHTSNLLPTFPVLNYSMLCYQKNGGIQEASVVYLNDTE